MHKGRNYENKKKFFKHKRSLYSMLEDNISFGEDDSEDDPKEILFMEIEEDLEINEDSKEE